MPESKPFEDMRDLIATLPEGDDAAALRTSEQTERESAFGGAGQLREIAAWLSRWSRKSPPRVDRPMLALFAGAHGVSRHGVSADTDAVVAREVAAISSGQGLLSRLCAQANVGLKVLDLALDLPTGDISVEPALDERACAATMAFGMEAVAGGHDLLCLSALGAARGYGRPQPVCGFAWGRGFRLVGWGVGQPFSHAPGCCNRCGSVCPSRGAGGPV